MGICAGAGFAAYETALDARVKALAMVSPCLTTQDDFFQRLGGLADVRAKLLPAGAGGQQKYFETGEDMMVQMVPQKEEEAKTARPIAVGMMEYHLPGKPGDVPNWKNNLSLISTAPMLSFSVFNYANEQYQLKAKRCAHHSYLLRINRLLLRGNLTPATKRILMLLSEIEATNNSVRHILL